MEKWQFEKIDRHLEEQTKLLQELVVESRAQTEILCSIAKEIEEEIPDQEMYPPTTGIVVSPQPSPRGTEGAFHHGKA